MREPARGLLVEQLAFDWAQIASVDVVAEVMSERLLSFQDLDLLCFMPLCAQLLQGPDLGQTVASIGKVLCRCCAVSTDAIFLQGARESRQAPARLLIFFLRSDFDACCCIVFWRLFPWRVVLKI